MAGLRGRSPYGVAIDLVQRYLSASAIQIAIVGNSLVFLIFERFVDIVQGQPIALVDR